VARNRPSAGQGDVQSKDGIQYKGVVSAFFHDNPEQGLLARMLNSYWNADETFAWQWA
jgi:hypothetical protein